MVTACIVLLYISYSIPVILLLKKGRSNIKPGPFWLGRFGHFCNYVLLMWTIFTLVMYSFPYAKPVTAGTMNYVSAVYAVTFSIIGIYWVARGKRTFRSREEREGVASTIPVLEHTKSV
jgi:choline transport protein